MRTDARPQAVTSPEQMRHPTCPAEPSPDSTSRLPGGTWSPRSDHLPSTQRMTSSRPPVLVRHVERSQWVPSGVMWRDHD